MNVKLSLVQTLIIPTKFKKCPIEKRFELYSRPITGRPKGNGWDNRMLFDTFDEMEEYVEANPNYDYTYYKRIKFDICKKVGVFKEVIVHSTLHPKDAYEMLDRMKSSYPNEQFRIIKRTKHE